MNKVERVIDLGARILGHRAELKKLEQELNQLLGEETTKIQEATISRRGSITDRMHTVFLENPGKVVAVPDFQKALPPETSVRTIRTTVTRLIDRSGGRIVSVGRGKYKYSGASELK